MITSGSATKKYNTAILNLFELILKLSEKQQHVLLKFTEDLFLKEKRTNDRKSCHIPIYYATSDRVYSSHIKNLSNSGLFIETKKMLPVGDVILMTFRMEGLNRPIKIKGEIAHTSRLGLGIKFKAINSQIAKKLQILVNQMKK